MGLFNLFNKKREEKKVAKNKVEMRIGFILLDSKTIEWNAFIENINRDWEISISEKPTDEGQLVFEVDDMKVACGLIEVPVPNNEAVNNAKNNFLWKEAVEVAESHKAHTILSVMGGDSHINQSILFTKLASSMLKLNNVIALYQFPTVISPEFYTKVAEDIKEGNPPILDWVYFGVYPDGNQFSGYTIGLNYFGKDEIEVIRTKKNPSELYEFLVDIAGYVIKMNATLNHGETIGFSEEHKLKITRSKGVALENESIKIEF